MSIVAKDKNLLRKIADEAMVIDGIVANNSEDAFLTDSILQRASVMALLNIGEMAAHLDPELRKEHGEIPWREIIALRNLAAHGYFVLDMPDIWKTISEDVPALKKSVTEIFAEIAEMSEGRRAAPLRLHRGPIAARSRPHR
jgi:uncharacterized protein with HEPN domain